MKGRLGRIALGVALSLVLAGCKKAETHSSLVCDRDAYILQSQAYEPDAGEGILSAPSAQPVVEGYFGKKYNQDWLAAVERSSILETIDYIETTGARVYRSDAISTKSAKTMGSLPKMAWDLDREWRKADRPLPQAPCGFLAGLYLGADTGGLPSLRDQSAIIVREDSSRWTLVHEFMHHNFKTQEAKTGYDDDQVQTRRFILLKQIEALKANRSISDKEYAQRLSDLFQALIDIADKILVQYQFEEVTVEATLQDQYEHGKLQYVPAGAYANATWYIDHSKNLAEELYKGMTATYDEIYRLASTNGLLAETKKISRYIALRDKRLAQLAAVIARRQNARGFSMGFANTEGAAPENGALPCAHAQALEDDVNAISAALLAPRAR